MPMLFAKTCFLPIKNLIITTKTVLLSASIFSILVLSGCGGGGDAGSSDGQQTDQTSFEDSTEIRGIDETSSDKLDTTFQDETQDQNTYNDLPSDNIIPDTISPAIELLGNNPLLLEAGETYSEPGAIATDNIDGEISVAIDGEIDSNSPGEYTITYSASDSTGNSASTQRTIIISDSTEPEIKILGDKNITLTLGEKYTELGATAYDLIDGDISDSIVIAGEVDTTLIGEYEITYQSVDAYGNTSVATRYITIKLPDYSFGLRDINPTLWEGDYKHYFTLDFTNKENIERKLTVEVSASSTASEGFDFKLNSSTIIIPPNEITAKLKIEIINDVEFEGIETINLDISGDVEDDIKQVTINISDTSSEMTHADLGTVFTNATAVAVDNKLVVLGYGRINLYDLEKESNFYVKRYSPSLGSLFSDSVSLGEQVYYFSKGALYGFDWTKYELYFISNTPETVDWVTELQIIDNEIFIAGGQTDFDSSSTTVYAFNISTQEWRTPAPLNQKRYGGASAVVDSKLIVFGGNYSRGTVEIYDPTLDEWSFLTSHTPISGGFNTACPFGDFIHVVLSKNSNPMMLSRYHYDSDTWSQVSIDLPSRDYQDSLYYKGRTYLVGGKNLVSGASNSVSSFYIGDDV